MQKPQILFLFIFTVFFPGCSILIDHGNLKLFIKTDIGEIKDSGIETEISYYRITGHGPLGFVYHEKVLAGDLDEYIMVWNLRAGAWEITINIYNVNDVVIAQDKIMANIIKNEIVNEFMYPVPVEGYGNLDIQVLVSESISDPLIDAFLILSIDHTDRCYLNTEISPHDPQLYLISGSGIPTGTHTIVVMLLNGETVEHGIVDTAVIIYSFTTALSYDFTSSGSIYECFIVPRLDSPIDVYTNINSTSINLGETLEIYGHVPSSFGPVIYIWSVNGEIRDIIDSTYLFKEFPAGTYTLSALVYTADRKYGGSVSDEITVTN